jgi:Tfp pilus assembly protein PilF
MNGRRVAVLLLLLGLVSQVGCLTMPWMVPDSAPPRSAEPATPAPPKPMVLRAPRSPEETARLCFTTAQLMEKNGHTDEAIHQYEQARQHDPQFKEVAHRLAVLYQRQGNYPRATEEFQLALKASPKDPGLLNDMGYYYYERDDWAEAEKWLRKAVAIAPKHARAWVNLGMTLGQQGRAEASFEAFAKVLPQAQAHSNVGILLVQQGKIEEARRELRNALALEPELAQARKVLEQLDHPTQALAPPARVPFETPPSP